MREFIDKIKYQYGLWLANQRAMGFFNVNFIATAEGANLDRLGALLECDRMDGESDCKYRKRLNETVQVVSKR